MARRSDSSMHSPRRLTLRLLCALLLLLTPLLSVADPQAPSSAGGTGDSPMGQFSDRISDQMPCHSGAAEALSAAPEPACPHCDPSAPSLQCDCCDAAAPTGVALLSVNAHYPEFFLDSCHEGLSSHPPCHPGERLFRPPIQFG